MEPRGQVLNVLNIALTWLSNSFFARARNFSRRRVVTVLFSVRPKLCVELMLIYLVIGQLCSDDDRLCTHISNMSN
jgi:hypothetical protein